VILKSISLKDYRNYDSLELEFSDNLNIFYGKNGQGKTNVIEALFLCAVGRSFRTSKDSECIKTDKEEYSISLDIKENIAENIKISYNKKKQKSIKVDGLYLRKIGQLMGSLLAVIFSPEDMMLITEGPSARRRFMDMAISQLHSSYFFDLQQYNKAILQKNSLLRDIKRKSMSVDTLSIWNDTISDFGSKIIIERAKFANKLSLYAEQKHLMITENKEKLNVEYDMILNEKIKDYLSDDKLSTNELYNRVREQFDIMLNNFTAREIEREMSLVGPHRDDLIFNLNGDDLKKFGSQGQKRTAVLACKMAEIEIMKNDTGRNPILLLDDVLSEIDIDRQNMLLNSISDIQTFITCVDINSLKNIKNDRINTFLVHNGTVIMQP